jgi:G3E family GTPase
LSHSLTSSQVAGKLPVLVITGFLGSGKSTLVKKLLSRPEMERVAVIINEFGEVGIDNELIAEVSENMTLLSNGCLCCTVRTDLEETLRELFIKRRAGEIIDFTRVVIETSGMADPTPVMHTLLTDGMVFSRYRLDGVVTLIDVVNGPGQLKEFPEAAKQIAVADRIVITKTDLAKAEAVEALREQLREANPYAGLYTAVQGEIDPALLLDVIPARAREGQIDSWLFGTAKTTVPGDATQGGAEEGGGYLGQRVRAEHTLNVSSFTLTFDAPFTWEAFSAVTQLLTSLRGPDLLRVKGLVNIVGESGPVVVQGAQHLFHPPVAMAAWPGEDRRSRIVFITRNIPRQAVEGLFTAAAGLVGH